MSLAVALVEVGDASFEAEAFFGAGRGLSLELSASLFKGGAAGCKVPVGAFDLLLVLSALGGQLITETCDLLAEISVVLDLSSEILANGAKFLANGAEFLAHGTEFLGDAGDFGAFLLEVLVGGSEIAGLLLGSGG